VKELELVGYYTAIDAATRGHRVARSHWHFVWLIWAPDKPGMRLEHDDGERFPYRSTIDDRDALDWYIEEVRP